MALAGGFTFRMEDQRSYESHGDGLQSEDGLIHMRITVKEIGE